MRRGYVPTTLAAIVGIIILDSLALWQGVDGVILMSALALIGGLAGYEVRKHHK